MDIRRAHERHKRLSEQTSTYENPGAGVELDEFRVRGRCKVEPQPLPQLSGINASRYYAGLRIARQQETEKLRLAQRTPKAIEASLAEARARPRRRGPFSHLPNPAAKARKFLADPVTRFWLGCNICTILLLFTASVLFMLFLYPILLRPVVKY